MVPTRSCEVRDGGGMHEAPSGQSRPAPLTVVLVEDHVLVGEQLTGLLGLAGIKVLATAPTIAAGYETVLARRPDVVVLDNQLPDGLGVDLCRRLTTHVPGIPVVMHSGAMTSTESLEAIGAGAAVVIPKSIRLDALIQAIRVNARVSKALRRS
jgi:DNA-binding NarL/FixJ family response regulator